jgi:hypothetical protein
MKTYLFFVLICLSQTTFSQKYKIDGSSPMVFCRGEVFELPNESIFLIKNIVDYNSEDFYFVLSIADRNGIELYNKKYNRKTMLSSEVFAQDSIIIIYRSIDSINNCFYAVSELVSFKLNSIAKDSIIVPPHNISTCKLVQQYKKTIFCWASFNNESIYDVDLILGSIDHSGQISDSLVRIKHDFYLPYKMLVGKSKDIYLFFSYAKVVVLDSNFNFRHNYRFTELDFTNDYDAFWSSDDTFIAGGTSIYNQLMVIESDLYLNELNKVVFESENTRKAGIYSNLAKTTDGFFFFGTSGYNVEYPATVPNNSLFITKLNNSFEVEWEKSLGNDAYYEAFSITGTKSGGCLLLASKYSYSPESDSEELVLFRISQNGDLGQLILGVDQKEKFINNIFPNPGQNQINLTLIENRNGIFKLYNIEGKLVYSQIYSGTQVTFGLPVLPKGMYLYEVINDDGKMERGKWIKQ